MSWENARVYCDWAELVLPTEAQWEYACRAGTHSDNEYWSGSGEAALAEVGWFRRNSDGRLYAVGEKPANPFGLHDMHGNIREWCLDSKNNYQRHARQGDGLREKPEDDSSHVVRGGSWDITDVNALSAFRDDWSPTSSDVRLGFRPAQHIP